VSRAQVEAALILLLIGGYLWMGLHLPPHYRYGTGVPGPEVFPIFLGIVMGAAALWQLIVSGKKRKNQEEAPVEMAGLSLTQRLLKSWQFYAMWVLVLLYVFLLPSLGFVISSWLLLLAFFFLLGEKRWYLGLGLAVVVPLGIYYLFTSFLGVRLPGGWLERILGG